jgi:hypothetical protein
MIDSINKKLHTNDKMLENIMLNRMNFLSL